MKIIVDAYNVLHTGIFEDRISDNQRKHFINLLSAYAKIKKHDVIAVFDAGPSNWPIKEEQKGITVMFSGIHRTADEAIMGYVQEHQGQNMLLVSSDRQLCSMAAAYDVPSLDAHDFYILISQRKPATRVHKQTHVVKVVESSDPQVDVLMQQLKRISIKGEDVDDPIDDRRSPAKKESRKKRQRQQKLKKL